MIMMGHVLFLTVSVCAASIACADGTQDFITLREQIKQMRVALARQGAYAFVTNHETTPRSAPHIHSQCWVDWLPRTNVEQIAYEQEKRDFGMDFVDELEKLALTEIRLEDADTHEQRVKIALSIAGWLKTGKGYGNQMLKRWSEGIALSSLGSMVINMQCDTNRVLKLMAKIDGWQENLVRQVAILNEESPHLYAIPKCATIKEASKDLERQWFPHQQTGMKYFQRKKKNGEWILRFRQAEDGPFEYAFYLPDCPNWTGSADPVKDAWRCKIHEAVCIYAWDEGMTDQIHQLLRWRICVGEFPRPSDAELNDSSLAFDYRSRLHDRWRVVSKGKERHFQGGSAVLKIYGNEFVDLNTRYLQLYRERKNQQWLKKNRKSP